MATNHTEKYELNQWLPTDPVIRTDFNADNAKIEATLEMLRINMLTAEIIGPLLQNLRNDINSLDTRVTALEN